MAEEHVVNIFLAHTLSLIATAIPFNCPHETVVGSSRTTYMSAFTLAFLSLTARHHENCVVVVERKRDESLRGQSIVLCCYRYSRMTLDSLCSLWSALAQSTLVVSTVHRIYL